MTIQTIPIYWDAGGTTAALVYDDVAMTASGILVHVPAGAKTVFVKSIINSTPKAVSYPGGTDTTFIFTSALPVSFVATRGAAQGITTAWFGQFCIGINGGLG